MPAPCKVVELRIFGHVRRTFQMIHEEVHNKLPKIDRMSTGMELLKDCSNCIKLIRKIYETDIKEKSKRSILFDELLSSLYDIDSVLILYRECEILSIGRHSEFAMELAQAIKECKNWKSF